MYKVILYLNEREAKKTKFQTPIAYFMNWNLEFIF